MRLASTGDRANFDEWAPTDIVGIIRIPASKHLKIRRNIRYVAPFDFLMSCSRLQTSRHASSRRILPVELSGAHLPPNEHTSQRCQQMRRSLTAVLILCTGLAATSASAATVA